MLIRRPAIHAVVLATTATFIAASLSPAASAEPEEALPPLADSLGIPLGFAIDDRETTGASADILLSHATQFTAENHMKPYAWYTGVDQFAAPPQVDTLMTFAVDNNLDVHGHTLVWHSQVPGWFFEDGAGQPLPADAGGQEVLRDRMRDHIFSVAEHLSAEYGAFGGGNPIHSFDVVNEVVANEGGTPGGLRESEWFRILGEDFIDLAFEYAEEAFNETYAAPGTDRPVALYINDYSTEWPDKRARLHALVERLLERDVPVDVVGHQFHVHSSVSVQQLDQTLTDFEDLDVEQAVTEFDRPTGTPVTQERLEDQAEFYRDAFEVFVAHRSVIAVSVWGVTDDRSWLADDGAPLLFDADRQPKPAAFAVAEVAPRITLVDVTPGSSAFYKEIMWLAERGISTGWVTEDGREFRPFENITRDAMAAFLYRYEGSPDVTLPDESPFVDITPTNTQFYKEIVWLSQQNITNGWEVDGGYEFRPFEPITRDAMAAFLYRNAGEPAWSDPDDSPFVDVPTTSPFFTEISWLQSTGVTNGWEVGETGTFEYRPFAPNTRDAMAAFLFRYDGNLR